MLAMWALVRSGCRQLTWPLLILMLVGLGTAGGRHWAEFKLIAPMRSWRACISEGSALAVAIAHQRETEHWSASRDRICKSPRVSLIARLSPRQRPARTSMAAKVLWTACPGADVATCGRARPIANLGAAQHVGYDFRLGSAGVAVVLWPRPDRLRRRRGLSYLFCFRASAFTQSRAGALQVALAAVAAMFGSGGSRPGSRSVMLASTGRVFMALVLVLPGLTNTLQLEPVQTLEQQVQPGRRLQIWAMALQQIAHRPFFGWGWTEGMGAQLALGDSGPLLHLLVTYAHNLLLDLLVWNGIPLGLTIFLAIAGWFVIRWRNHAPADRPMLLALTCLLIHALVELPHAYAFFLLPAGLMVGVIEAHVAKRPVLAAPRFLIVGLTVLLALVLAVVSVEYVRIEAALLETRMRIARVGTHAPPSPPQVWLLRPFVELLEVLVITPDITLDNAELDKVRRVAERFPSGPNLFRYAQSAALTGRPDEARRALALICQVTPPGHCQASSQAWRLLADTKYPAMATILPPSKCAAEIRLPPRQQSPDPAGADKFGRMPLNPLCDHDPSP